MKRITSLSLATLTLLSTPVLAENNFSFMINQVINEKQYASAPPAYNVYGHTWVGYRGFTPYYAVEGGREPGRNLFICQTQFRGGMHPGKVVDGNCNITYGGREIARPSFNVLVGENLYWADPYAKRINPVIGGFENGRPLYICQARVHRGFHPGKLVDGYCNIGYAGREIQAADFVLLSSERPRGHHYRNYVFRAGPAYIPPMYPGAGPVRPIRPSVGPEAYPQYPQPGLRPVRPSVGPSADVRPARPYHPSVGPARPSVGPSADIRPVRPVHPSVGPARPSVGPSAESVRPVRPVRPGRPSVGPADEEASVRPIRPSIGAARPSLGSAAPSADAAAPSVEPVAAEAEVKAEESAG